MNLEKSIFAKEDLDDKRVRFFTALRLTSKKYAHRNVNAVAILFALSDFGNSNLTGYQKNAIAHLNFSSETTRLMKEFFLEIYNNDDMLLKYLNGIISDRYFALKKKPARELHEVNSSIATVLNDNVKGFFDDLIL